MQILFINTNPIVQKLIEVTAAKANVKLVTVSEPSQIDDIAKYDYIIADDGCYGIDKSKYKQFLKDRRACLIYSKEMYSGFSEYIKKPFIPTHILNIIIEEIAKSKKEHSFESMEEEVVPEDMSVDSVLQATRAMRTEEDSLSNLDLLSKELNIKHKEATSQEKVSSTFAKESKEQPPAKQISAEDLLSDTDLHKDEDAQEALDIDDINLDDLVSENEGNVQETTSQEVVQSPQPSEEAIASNEIQSTPKTQEDLKEDLQEDLTQSAKQDLQKSPSQKDNTLQESQIQEPQVLDKEQISEVSELLNAIGGEVEFKELDTKESTTKESFPKSRTESSSTQDESQLAQSNQTTDDLVSENEGNVQETTSQEVVQSPQPSEEAIASNEIQSTPDAQDSSQSTKEASSDESIDLDLDRLGLEIGEKIDGVNGESSVQDIDDIDIDSLDLSLQEDRDELQEITQDLGGGSSQDAKEFFADVPSESVDTLDLQEVPTDEVGESLALAPQDAKDSKDDMALEDAEQDVTTTGQEAQSDISLQDSTKEVQEEDLALDEPSIKEGAKEALDELADIQSQSEEASSTESAISQDTQEAQDNLNGLQGNLDSSEDFTNLNENEVAVALGEGPLPTNEVLDISTQQESKESSATQDNLDTVKNAIGKSLEGALQSMVSSDIKTLLDGMEVSINISFKDTKK